MPTEESTKKELVDSLKSAVRKIKDEQLLKLTKSYIKLILSLNAQKENLNGIIEQYLSEDKQISFESIIQDIESKILNTNSDLLDYIDIVDSQRSVVAKNELKAYFLDTIKSIMKEHNKIISYLDRFLRTCNADIDKALGSDDAIESANRWLKNRLFGSLLRIDKQNIKLTTLLEKIRREQITNECYKYMKKNMYRM